jgi:hypothetical protein
MEADFQAQEVLPELTTVSSNTGSSNKLTLLAREVYRNDPCMVFFRDRLSLNNSFGLGILVLVSICCFYGLYTLPGTGHEIANQPLFALLEVVTATLFYVAYFWLSDSIAILFNTLWTDEILNQSVKNQDTSTAYAKFIKDLLLWLNSPWWPVGSLIFIIAYLITRYLVNGPPFLTYVPLWLQLVTALLDGIIAYFALITVSRLLISLVFANRLFRSFTIHVKPLHPDGVGGLGAMRSIVWVSALIILAMTLTFFETILISTNRNPFSSTLDIVTLIVAYAILAPSLILGWLIMPHLLMLKERDAVLKPLVDEFQAILESPQPITDTATAGILADNDRLSAIKRRYSLIVDTFPTWPLEVTQIRRLVATLSLPALISLIPSIMGFINLIFKQLLK